MTGVVTTNLNDFVSQFKISDVSGHLFVYISYRRKNANLVTVKVKILLVRRCF